MSHPWSGVFPAVTTKMAWSCDLDLPAMRESLERLIANGVSGAIVLPMLGENASLTLAEREAVIRTAAEVVDGRIPLLSGLAETTLGTATANAQLYRSWGAQRSEEHTSELQSLMRISYAVFCLKKKKKNRIRPATT